MGKYSFVLEIYIRNHVLEVYSRKGPFNAWSVKVIKGHTIAIRNLYYVKDIGRGYRLEMTRRTKKQVLKVKSKIMRSLKANISINEAQQSK